MGGPSVEQFIQRWQGSGGSELANSQAFLIELCDLLEVPRPEPARPEAEANAYTFERQVTFHNGDGSTSIGRVDLYRRGCFVLESKQGVLREEARGIVRWLRPEYQAPTQQAPVQGALAGMAQPEQAAKVPTGKQPWPSALPDQAQAVRQALESLGGPADTATVAKLFTRAPRARVQELLETLAGLGQAQVLEKGKFSSSN